MDAFFAAVEQLDRPELRGKAVVVGAPPDRRGVVAAASYEARRFGVHSAMPSREAARRCPHAVFLPVNGRRYEEVSRQVFAIFERFTPLVEPLSIDEAFLDVTGASRLFGGGVDIARRLKAAIHAEIGLTASVGVAPNKFLAKLASEMHKPDGLTVVPTARAAIVEFLAPLPADRLWGIGEVTRNLLDAAGLRTIGDIQRLTEPRLAALVGKHAASHFRRLAFGEDAREIELDAAEKSISREHTFDRDCTSAERVRAVLLDLADDVGRRLREDGRSAGLARLKLRWRGFTTITRQRPLCPPCCDDFSLRQAADGLLSAVELNRPVRLVGFGVAHLGAGAAEQLLLFGEDARARVRKERLSRAVDAIRGRLGGASIGRGRSRPAFSPQARTGDEGLK
jgi:DNA polymerase-4